MPSLDASHLQDKCKSTMPCQGASITMVMSFVQRLTALVIHRANAQQVKFKKIRNDTHQLAMETFFFLIICRRQITDLVPTDTQIELIQDTFRRHITSKKRNVARIQLAFVGAFGAGKTNLCSNLIKPGFNEESDSTVGIDLLHTSVVLQKRSMFPESSSAPRQSCGPLLTNAPKAAAISSSIAWGLQPARVTKPANECFFPKAEQPPPSKFHIPGALMLEVKKAMKDTEDEVIFADLLDCGGQLSFSVCQSVCFSENTIFFLIYNSSIPMNVEIAASFRDGGGNRVQYATPKLLHSDYLCLWLSTLSMIGRNRSPGRQPIVVLVGTHSAKLSESEGRASDVALRSLLRKYSDAPLRILGPFRVDSKYPEADAMASYRRVVHRLIQQEAIMNPTPLSFLHCEWLVRQRTNLAAKGESIPPFLSLSDFKVFAQQAADISAKGALLLLEYLNVHGAVRRFNRSPLREDDIVFMDIRWLLKQVAQVISITMSESSREQLSASESKDVDDLRKRGLLSSRLCCAIWRAPNGTMLPPSIHKALLYSMEYLGLQCPVEGDERYGLSPAVGFLHHMPICIQREASGLPDLPLPTESEAMPTILLRFDERFFPIGEFSKMAVLVLQRCKPRRPEVDLLSLRFWLRGRNRCYVAEMHYDEVGVRVGLTCTSPVIASGNGGESPSMAESASSLLQHVQDAAEQLQLQIGTRFALTPAFRCPFCARGMAAAATGSLFKLKAPIPLGSSHKFAIFFLNGMHFEW